MNIPWSLVFVIKIFIAVAVVDVAFLPILWSLRAPLPTLYVQMICLEGGLITLIGVLLLVNSLFSKVAMADDRYVGFGTIRRGIRFKELKSEQKHTMRKRGILMLTVGLLLFIPTLVAIINA